MVTKLRIYTDTVTLSMRIIQSLIGLDSTVHYHSGLESDLLR